MISWETVPDRFRKGPESKVMWFEERPEGGWDWKFETLGPGNQPRYEHRIYAILGAESRDRERLLLIPGSPPIRITSAILPKLVRGARERFSPSPWRLARLTKARRRKGG